MDAPTQNFDWIPLKAFTAFLSKPTISAFKRVVFFDFNKVNISDTIFECKQTGASKSSGILVRSPDYKISKNIEQELVFKGLQNGMKLYEFYTDQDVTKYLPLTEVNEISKIIILLYENP